MIRANSTAVFVQCPRCRKPSTNVHSYYTRTPRDLPSSEQAVHLVLGVRRFRCHNPACPQKTFVERIPQVVPAHGQRTTRLTEKLRAMVFETSAEACSRMTHHMNMGVSGDTLLPIIRQTEPENVPTPEVLGMDDWAYKEGTRYGTLLVDLEASKPIDMLPSRSAKSVAEWLQKHPGIAIISRDRSKEYIAGINAGAPDAIQVADRWHLLCNLREAVEKLMKAYARDLKTVSKSFLSSPVSADHADENELMGATEDDPSPPTRRELRFDEVKRLAAQGYTQRAIARQSGVSRTTVKRYLDADELPEYGPRAPAVTILTPYVSYIEDRWTEGCHNARVLWEEIQLQGFAGSYSTVRRFVRRYRTNKGQRVVASMTVRPTKNWSPRQVAWLLLCDPDNLDQDDKLFLDRLCQLVPDIADAHQLAQRFIAMVQERLVDHLTLWLADAENCNVSQLRSFAVGLRRDYAAVRAALEYAWSNGPVEGHINRLKVIKRLMYGRAKFDLLRLRVLHPA